LDAFAAVRSADGALTVMVINKDITNAIPVTLNISNFTATGSAQVWQLAGSSIAQLTSAGVTNGILNETVPSQSITLFVVPGVAPTFQMQAGMSGPGKLQLTLTGQQNQSYVIQASTNLATWTPMSTNLLLGNSTNLLVPTANSGGMFYRAALQSP
jgi:hypothetical protein